MSRIAPIEASLDEDGLTPYEIYFCEEYVANGLVGVDAVVKARERAGLKATTRANTKAEAWALLYKRKSREAIHARIRLIMENKGLSEHHANTILAGLMVDPNPFVRLRAVELLHKMHGRIQEMAIKVETRNAVIVIGGNQLKHE